jgi:hypothetical protein
MKNRFINAENNPADFLVDAMTPIINEMFSIVGEEGFNELWCDEQHPLTQAIRILLKARVEIKYGFCSEDEGKATGRASKPSAQHWRKAFRCWMKGLRSASKMSVGSRRRSAHRRCGRGQNQDQVRYDPNCPEYLQLPHPHISTSVWHRARSCCHCSLC